MKHARNIIALPEWLNKLMSKAVHDMFADIAPRYDWANDVLSLGMHRLWRNAALKSAGIAPGNVFVDLCTGTGDVAFAAARKMRGTGKVVGIDFVLNMLCLAEEKKKKTKERSDIKFVQGDAQALPLPDNFADAAMVSFGIRNVDDPSAGLREMGRVVRPGGKIIVLEFGQPTVFGFALLFRLYSKYLMPMIGSILTGNRKAYEYLPETSKNFPAADQFTAIMQKSGLASPKYRAICGGVAYIYSADAASKACSKS